MTTICFMCRKAVHDMENGMFGPSQTVVPTRKVVPIVFICVKCVERFNLFQPPFPEEQDSCVNCVEHA